MIRRHGTLLRVVLASADAAAVVLLFTVISQLRFGDDWPRIWRALFNEPWAPAAIMAVGWVAILWTQGLYRLRQRWSFEAQVVAMVRALLAMTLLSFAALFLVKLDDVSRAFLFAMLPSLAVASLLLRAGILGWLAAVRMRGLNTRNVVIVGSGTTALQFAKELEGHPALGLRVLGYVNGEADHEGMGWPYLGETERLADVLHDHVIDEVAVCLDLAAWETIEQIIELCRAEGKIVRIPLAGGILTHGGAQVENFAGIAILSIVQGPDRQLALGVKRIVDVAVALAGLLLSIPVTLLVALAILREDGAPIFFRQERVGLHGRRFRVLKFRTMRHDAEDLLPELKALNEVNGQAFKVTDDPRVTSVGRLLRRTSLDELPQFWNVLRGDMSIVGPRPVVADELPRYGPWRRTFLSLRPGITGPWQISGRNDIAYAERVRMDVEYAQHASFRRDMAILLATVRTMFKTQGNGAY